MMSKMSHFFSVIPALLTSVRKGPSVKCSLKLLLLAGVLLISAGGTTQAQSLSVNAPSVGNALADDLFIGFQSPAGSVQNSTDYLIDLGQATFFTTDTNQILKLGQYGGDLTAVFGASWFANTGVLWGAVAGSSSAGTTSNGTNDPAHTIYLSAPTSAVGTAATAFTRKSSGSQATPDQKSLQLLSAFNQGQYTNSYAGTSLSTNAVAVTASDLVSWSSVNSYMALAYNRSIESAFTNLSATSAVLDLFRLAPGSGAAQNLGFLGIDNLGNITFTPYALSLGGGGGAYAGPWNWTGGSGNWSASNNWLSNAIASNGYAVGIAGGAGGTITNDLVSNVSTLTYSNGAGSFTLTGTNAGQTLLLTGGITNNASATQAISLGLLITNSQTFSASSGNLSLAGPLSNAATLTLREGSLQTITFGGSISGGGSLVQSGSGTMILGASNSFGGGSVLNGGTTVASDNQSFGTGVISVASNAVIASGVANLVTTNAVTVAGGATMTLAPLGNNWSQNGRIGGDGAMANDGTGTLILGSSNSYTGGTALNGGTVVIGSSAALGSGTVTVSAPSTLAGGAGVSVGNVIQLNASLGLDNRGNDWVQSGAISGSASLTLSGAGTTTLAALNNYNGQVTVQSGTAQVTGSLAETGAIMVSGSATLSGTGSVGTVSVARGATLVSGNSGGIGSLAISNMIWNPGGNLNEKIADASGGAGTAYDSLIIRGGLNLSALSASNTFNINLWSLSGTNPSVNGQALNFNPNSSTNWLLASVSGSITGFASNAFTISTAATNGSGGFANAINGTFAVSTNATGLILTYTTAYVAAAGATWSAGSGNLASNSAITNGSGLVFSGAGGSVTNSTLGNLASITYSNSAGGYTLGGAALTIGAGGIVNNSTNAQIISNALSLGSAATFTAGSGSLILAGTIANGGNALTVNGPSNAKISGVISGAGGIVSSGTGTLVLSGADLFTGGVSVNSGVLLLCGGDNRLWTNSSVVLSTLGTLNLGTNNQQLGSMVGSGTVTGSSGTLTLSPTNSASFGGNITGSLTLAKTGSSTLTLTSSNSYTGGTRLNGGTVVMANANALGSQTNVLFLGSGGTLNLGAQSVTQGSVTVTGGSITNGTLSASTLTLQGGSVSASLAGSTAVTQASGTTTLSGSNAFSGGVSIEGGLLVSSNAAALGGGSLSVKGGALDLKSFSQQLGAVTLGNGTITGTGVLTPSSLLITNTGAALVSEKLSGSGGLIQSGTGTTTLSSSNSFSGGIAVNGGTLLAANANALGSTNASITVSGGTLDLGGQGIQLGAATLTSGSIGNGTFTAAAGITVSGASNSAISAVVLGKGGLMKSGSGTLNLATALPSGSVRIAGGALQSSASVIGAAVKDASGVWVSNGASWQNSGILTIGGYGSGSLTLYSGSGLSASGLLIASGTNSKGTLIIGDTGGSAGLSLGSGSISFGTGSGNMIFNESGAFVLTNRLTSLSAGKGVLTSSGSGTTTLFADDSGFSGSTYLSSGTVMLGTNSQLGGTLNIAAPSAKLLMGTNSSLTGTGTHAIAGLLLDNSGLTFTNSIKGKVVLASGGELQKTYVSGSSVAGFGAGIGAGRTFAILAGTVSTNSTLSAKLVNGALDFKGTFTNAAVMAITDPSYSTIRNTIQWYNTNTGTWQNTVQGNGQGGAVANVSTNTILQKLGTTNAKLWGSSGFIGSFATFLLDSEGETIAAQKGVSPSSLTASSILGVFNSLSANLINQDLAAIMGAYGYDVSSHTAWAVIDHNSIFDSGFAAVTPELEAAALADIPVTADLSAFGVSSFALQTVPEPGEWGLLIVGTGMVFLFLRRRHLRGRDWGNPKIATVATRSEHFLG